MLKALTIRPVVLGALVGGVGSCTELAGLQWSPDSFPPLAGPVLSAPARFLSPATGEVLAVAAGAGGAPQGCWGFYWPDLGGDEGVADLNLIQAFHFDPTGEFTWVTIHETPGWPAQPMVQFGVYEIIETGRARLTLGPMSAWNPVAGEYFADASSAGVQIDLLFTQTGAHLKVLWAGVNELDRAALDQANAQILTRFDCPE